MAVSHTITPSGYEWEMSGRAGSARRTPQDCLDSAHDPRMWGCHKGDMRLEARPDETYLHFYI